MRTDMAEQNALSAYLDLASPKPISGRIISGMRLSIAAQKRIVEKFEKMLGVPVTLTCKVDSKEIGGVRVELDGYSYNGTVRGQLHDIYDYLLNKEEEADHAQ